MILRGLQKGQKKEIYFWNKTEVFSSSAYTTSSCKIVVASKRPLILVAAVAVFEALVTQVNANRRSQVELAYGLARVAIRTRKSTRKCTQVVKKAV